MPNGSKMNNNRMEIWKQLGFFERYAPDFNNENSLPAISIRSLNDLEFSNQFDSKMQLQVNVPKLPLRRKEELAKAKDRFGRRIQSARRNKSDMMGVEGSKLIDQPKRVQSAREMIPKEFLIPTIPVQKKQNVAPRPSRMKSMEKNVVRKREEGNKQAVQASHYLVPETMQFIKPPSVAKTTKANVSKEIRAKKQSLENCQGDQSQGNHSQGDQSQGNQSQGNHSQTMHEPSQPSHPKEASVSDSPKSVVPLELSYDRNPRDYYEQLLHDRGELIKEDSKTDVKEGFPEDVLRELTKSFQTKLKKQYNLMYKEIESEQKKHKKEILEMKQFYESKVDTLMTKYFTFKSQRKSVPKQDDVYKKKFLSLQTKSKEQQNQIDELMNSKESLLHDIDKHIEDNASLKDRVSHLEEERAILKEALASNERMKQKVIDLERHLRSYESRNRKLTAELESERKRFFEEREMLQDEIDYLQAELGKEEKSVAVLKTLDKKRAMSPDMIQKIESLAWTQGDYIDGYTPQIMKESHYSEKHVQKARSIIIHDDSFNQKKHHLKKKPISISTSSTYLEDRLLHIQGHLIDVNQNFVKMQRQMRYQLNCGRFAHTEEREFLEQLEVDLQGYKTHLNTGLIRIGDMLRFIKCEYWNDG